METVVFLSFQRIWVIKGKGNFCLSISNEGTLDTDTHSLGSEPSEDIRECNTFLVQQLFQTHSPKRAYGTSS